MAPELSIIIKVKNLAKRGFDKASAAVSSFRKKFSAGAIGVLKSVVSLRTGLVAFAGISALFVKSLQKAFEFERYKSQFSILFGDMEQAKSHFEDLKEFANVTPFQLSDLAQASKTMLSMTGGVLGLKDSLTLVGDAAAKSGFDIKEVGMWTARAYGAIRNGKPFGEAAMRLTEMGLLSGEARQKMEDLQKAGAKNTEVWKVLREELEKSKGGMELLSTTGEGLMSTLKDKWDGALADFGARFQDLAKDKIKQLIDWIDRLKENGTLDRWAKGAVDALTFVAKALRAVGKGIAWVVDKVQFAAGVAGAMSAGVGLGAAVEVVQAGRAEEKAEKDAGEARATAKAKERAAAAIKAKEQAAKDEIAAQARIAADMAEGQKAADKKRAEKEAKEKKKADAKALKERQKAAKELASLEKALAADDRGKRQKIIEESLTRAEQRKETWTDAFTRAQTIRQESSGDRRARRKRERRRAKDRSLSIEELADLRKRNEDVGDLTRGEEEALRADEKNKARVDKLLERERKGENLSPFEKRLIDERLAQERAIKAAADIKKEKENLEKLKLEREREQAKDIKEIRKKIDGLLTLKNGG